MSILSDFSSIPSLRTHITNKSSHVDRLTMACSISVLCSCVCTSLKPVAVEAEGPLPEYLSLPVVALPSALMHALMRGVTWLYAPMFIGSSWAHMTSALGYLGVGGMI